MQHRDPPAFRAQTQTTRAALSRQLFKASHVTGWGRPLADFSD